MSEKLKPIESPQEFNRELEALFHRGLAGFKDGKINLDSMGLALDLQKSKLIRFIESASQAVQEGVIKKVASDIIKPDFNGGGG